MENTRTHIVMSASLVAEIDKVVGKRGRSSFFAQAAEKELKRQRLAKLFVNPKPIWDIADHPELKHGSVAWVRKLRKENDRRLEKIWAKYNRSA